MFHLCFLIVESLKVGARMAGPSRAVDNEAYRAWYAEKQRVDVQEAGHRCKARRAHNTREERALLANPPQATSMPLEHGLARVSRICTDLGREIAEFASSRLEHHDTRIQHLTVQKFLGHTSMKDMIPP
jgi:hypothetical protein